MSSLRAQEEPRGWQGTADSPCVPQTGRCHPGCGSATRHRPPARAGGGGLHLSPRVPRGFVPGESFVSPQRHRGDTEPPPSVTVTVSPPGL